MAAAWAGAAAPGAQIVLVPATTTKATDGLDLSLAAIVDQALAHTLTVGYSACEASFSETHRAFYAAIYQQAAAAGIAVIAATGDSGPAACQAAGGDARVSSGYGVNPSPQRPGIQPWARQAVVLPDPICLPGPKSTPQTRHMPVAAAPACCMPHRIGRLPRRFRRRRIPAKGEPRPRPT